MKDAIKIFLSMSYMIIFIPKECGGLIIPLEIRKVGYGKDKQPKTDYRDLAIEHRHLVHGVHCSMVICL